MTNQRLDHDISVTLEDGDGTRITFGPDEDGLGLTQIAVRAPDNSLVQRFRMSVRDAQALFRSGLEMLGGATWIDRIEQERDVALARIRELEAKVGTMISERDGRRVAELDLKTAEALCAAERACRKRQARRIADLEAEVATLEGWRTALTDLAKVDPAEVASKRPVDVADLAWGRISRTKRAEIEMLEDDIASLKKDLAGARAELHQAQRAAADEASLHLKIRDALKVSLSDDAVLCAQDLVLERDALRKERDDARSQMDKIDAERADHLESLQGYRKWIAGLLDWKWSTTDMSSPHARGIAANGDASARAKISDELKRIEGLRKGATDAFSTASRVIDDATAILRKPGFPAVDGKDGVPLLNLARGAVQKIEQLEQMGADILAKSLPPGYEIDTKTFDHAWRLKDGRWRTCFRGESAVGAAWEDYIVTRLASALKQTGIKIEDPTVASAATQIEAQLTAAEPGAVERLAELGFKRGTLSARLEAMIESTKRLVLSKNSEIEDAHAAAEMLRKELGVLFDISGESKPNLVVAWVQRLHRELDEAYDAARREVVWVPPRSNGSDEPTSPAVDHGPEGGSCTRGRYHDGPCSSVVPRADELVYDGAGNPEPDLVTRASLAVTYFQAWQALRQALRVPDAVPDKDAPQWVAEQVGDIAGALKLADCDLRDVRRLVLESLEELDRSELRAQQLQGALDREAKEHAADLGRLSTLSKASAQLADLVQGYVDLARKRIG